MAEPKRAGFVVAPAEHTALVINSEGVSGPDRSPDNVPWVLLAEGGHGHWEGLRLELAEASLTAVAPTKSQEVAGALALLGRMAGRNKSEIG